MECDRRGKRARGVRPPGASPKGHHMPEAVIVDAVRTPIGRAVKGSLKDVRADDLAAVAAQGAGRAQPELDFAEIVDVMMGAASARASRATTSPATRRCSPSWPSRPRLHRQPLLRLVAADDPHGLPRDQGRRGRPVHRRRRRGRLAHSAWSAGTPSSSTRKLDGSEGSLYNVYIPMGLTAENVAERYERHPRGAGRLGGDLPEPRGRAPGAATSTARSSRSTCRTAPRSQGRRPAARHDDGEARAAASRPSGRTARSRPATRAR